MPEEARVELLRGRHALLRLTRASDAEVIVEWRNRADTGRWLNQEKPLTIEDHLRWYRAATERGDLLLFFEGVDGEPVGCCSIFDFDSRGTSGEWGRLFSASFGRGSSRMLECCYLLHRLCFDALGFFRLHGVVWADNERAWRLYQFLGWTEEGVRRQHFLAADGYHDVRVIRVFGQEFAKARAALEQKLYGADPPPVVSDAEAHRLRALVGGLIHRPL